MFDLEGKLSSRIHAGCSTLLVASPFVLTHQCCPFDLSTGGDAFCVGPCCIEYLFAITQVALSRPTGGRLAVVPSDDETKRWEITVPVCVSNDHRGSGVSGQKFDAAHVVSEHHTSGCSTNGNLIISLVVPLSF